MDSDERRSAASIAALLASITAASYFFLIRPWHLKWGTKKEELIRGMLGDELILYPTYVTHRAITVEARPADIWPWIVQMGQGRGGFYSYDWIENWLRKQSKGSDRVLSEFQNLQLGDMIPIGPESGIPVLAIEHERALLLGTPEPRTWGNSTWSIGLYPIDDRTTRLVSRVKTQLNLSWKSIFWLLLLDPGQFLIERKWLYGIKERAEKTARRGAVLHLFGSSSHQGFTGE